jgi:hypothetical protein
MIAYVPISIGELLDKITILQIKMDRISNPEKLVNISNELRCLMEIYEQHNLEGHDDFVDLYQDLLIANQELWELEDRIRELMARPTTDQEFIDTGVLIHRTNDQRAAIKKQINIAYKSDLIEEKSYKEAP